jgi:hypothetical protein
MAIDDDIDVSIISAPDEDEQRLFREVMKNYTYAQGYEAEARNRFDYDYRFANGDTHNKYQWDDELVASREDQDKPCLTINKTRQHNLMIINDAKQNKPGIRIRPVGDNATFEAAQVFQELVYHIEYISSAENVYDAATTWQVEAGWGYWRVITDYISPNSFDQEIYIRRIKDPRSVYLDPDIVEVDGSDARWGIVFEEVPREVFNEKYPDHKGIVGTSSLGAENEVQSKGWVTKEIVRVAEYFKRIEEEDKLVTWVGQQGQVLKRVSQLDDMEKLLYKEIRKDKANKELYQYRERDVLTNNVKLYKIAGDRVIEETDWLGDTIPIVRLIGCETVIDGVWDCKGHTRALIDAQRIYNYNTSANVEFGALQTKAPWIAAAASIEGYENYYETANKSNHSYMPYNHIDDMGHPIPPPARPQPPMPSPAYVQGMEIAQNEMMMASGQYQAQFGENENAKSGVAINARQRQGDRATYHFIDNQAIAIRRTGKILIDLIPKVYDTERVRRITAQDGRIMNVNIQPNAQQAYEKVDHPDGQQFDKNQQVDEIIFNPNVGLYDIQSDTGPSFATKRMETAAALTQIAAADKEFMKVGGDILFGTLDFPKADVLAERYKKMLPPNLTGDAPDPQVEQVMHQAADQIQQLQGMVAELQRQLKDKTTQLTQSGMKIDLEHKKAMTQEARDDYKAETERVTALGNAGPGVSVEQIQPVLRQLLAGMAQNGELIYKAPGPHEGGTPIQLPPEPENATGEAGSGQAGASDEEPPVEGAEKANDGNWYVKHGEQYYRVGA